MADDISGMHYAQARYYMPQIGRFSAQDTIHDGLNWYEYCRSNPLRFIDKDGNMASDAARQRMGQLTYDLHVLYTGGSGGHTGWDPTWEQATRVWEAQANPPLLNPQNPSDSRAMHYISRMDPNTGSREPSNITLGDALNVLAIPVGMKLGQKPAALVTSVGFLLNTQSPTAAIVRGGTHYGGYQVGRQYVRKLITNPIVGWIVGTLTTITLRFASGQFITAYDMWNWTHHDFPSQLEDVFFHDICQHG